MALVLPDVRITRDCDVYVGDTKLPGIIAEDGIRIDPGSSRDLNRLTVTFLVAHVEMEAF